MPTFDVTVTHPRARCPRTRIAEATRAGWRAEILGHEELFIDLHTHLPKELIYERELLICRL